MSFSPRDGYQIHIPDGPGPHPAIIFLHGYGESGTDNEAQLREGLPTRLDLYGDFVIVAPQKTDFDHLWPVFSPLLGRVLGEVERDVLIGDIRVLTGLSQGGHGTINLARSLPWQFSALVPVCGWADPRLDLMQDWGREHPAFTERSGWASPEVVRATIRQTPIWLFHGEDDAIVPANRSREVADLVNEGGGKAMISVYEGVGHDSWVRAYAEPELADWMRNPR